MTNAKTEFLRTTNGNLVIGAKISIIRNFYRIKIPDGYKDVEALLNPGYSQEEYEQFLESINIEYDSGFGTQELFGIIFCENGVWYDRSEYDGAEGWDYHAYPDMREVFDEKYVISYERSKKLERIIIND